MFNYLTDQNLKRIQSRISVNPELFAVIKNNDSFTVFSFSMDESKSAHERARIASHLGDSLKRKNQDVLAFIMTAEVIMNKEKPDKKGFDSTQGFSSMYVSKSGDKKMRMFIKKGIIMNELIEHGSDNFKSILDIAWSSYRGIIQ